VDVFKPIPIDVMQLNEKTAVELFVKQEDRLMTFLGKGGKFTRDHLIELNRYGISRIYIRGRDAIAFEEYVHANSENILNDSTVPSKVKAATFYVSSIHALRKAFDFPNPEQVEEMKNTLKPLLKNIMQNQVLLNDLFSITEHDFSTYKHCVNVGIFATSLAVHFYKNDRTVGMEDLERLSYG
jgi:HD-GYP domain-containing protein (c-di-GMP phosphodiesterase class II)